MGDITSGTSLLSSYHLAGENIAILQHDSASASDTIELDNLLEANGLGKRVKVVRYAHCVEDFSGTPVNRAMKWNKNNDTLTIGSGPSSATVTIKVEYE